MKCNDEKIKNWKSDVFRCRSIELAMKDSFIEIGPPDLMAKGINYYFCIIP